MTRVVRVVQCTADLEVYRERASRLPAASVTGWLELARWAEARGLLTQAREGYAYVLTLDPENAAAHRGLGHVWAGDRWATLEDSYRARGYVQFEGSWVTPEERRAILEERLATAAAERERMEAAARVRETEARARVAEAEARRAEYDAAQADGAIPLGYPYGGVYGGYGSPVLGGAYDPLDPYAVAPPPPSPTVIVAVPVPRPPRDHARRSRPADRPRHGGNHAGIGPRDPKRDP
jgi:hypothetical protein